MPSIRLDPSLMLGTGASWTPGVRDAPSSRPPAPTDAVTRPKRLDPTTGPIRTTAYQRNADGDDASLTSKANDLTPEERDQVEKLKKRDQEVRTHEQAHLAAAGALARGGPSYTYQRGPDANRYAVGGSVQIDTSPGRTPEETIAKAQQIRRAALAPAKPSSTDRAVAAKAAKMEGEARAKLAEQRTGDEASNKAGNGPSSASAASERLGEIAAPRFDAYA